MKKNILGLDLGTNSIGWALVEQDFGNKYGKILGMGSRIIPMDQKLLGEFGAGNSVSQTAERTNYRSIRRLRERYLLRRERLHRVLNIMGFLPRHYAAHIDFEKRLGQFKNEAEPKLVYNDDKAFIFKKSFEEMLADFRKHQPQVLVNERGEPKLIPYDWTIYYLRKKALTEKIEKEELAWILLNFNQKRGYYQLREEEDNSDEQKEYVELLKIVKVIKGEKDRKNENKNWYTIIFSNDWEYSATFSSEPNWLNTEREFLIIEEYDADGNIKIVKDRRKDVEGKEKRRITPLPTFEEINLMSKKDQDKIYKKIKTRTEITIRNSQNTVGAYIYDALLQNPKQKIKGKLVRTIERKFYKDELRQILRKQKEFHAELQSDDLYNDCVRELYRNNEAHQLQLEKKDFVHLFLEDIIFYQRPLRSQKSSIGNCALEYRTYKNKEGVEEKQYLKAIPKSNPYYQEFRVWQWLYNLKIYRKEDDSDVTDQFINSTEDRVRLFKFLMSQEKVDHKNILKHLFASSDLKGKALTAEMNKYRWNYVYDTEKDESKKYPMNETHGLISSRLEKVEGIADDFLTREIEQQLWHLIYSVTDKVDYEKALTSFAAKHGLDEASFVAAFIKFPPFKSEFGSYSEKAIKKLLPLMRLGKYWDENAIVVNSSIYWDNINKLLEKLNKKSETISEKDKEDWNKTINTKLEAELRTFLDGEVQSFQGLRLHIAQYLVYGRHSEAVETNKWNSINDLELFLEDFKQHSLRNPIVEQVVTETLRVVKDIWKQYGKGAENFFSEIHVELGREMKNTADERKRLTNMISENENTNLRIKALLAEMMNDTEIENVRPYSPMQQEILKVFEEGVLNSDIEIEEDILKISKTAQPSSSDLRRYKLWLEQKYKSPYTGAVIPLNKLFTPEYEIEHIIPQSRYFDDSMSNKIICETAVNKLKDNQLGLEFIKNHRGEMVGLGMGKSVRIFDEAAYTDFVKRHYAKNRSKRNKLLLEDIPEKMIERQLNDTRYIAKYISNLLSNLVRSESNDDGPNSKNLIPGNGKITGELKQDWGLNDVWNELILPRFERLNQLTGETHFTAWNENHQKYLPTVPLELSKGFSKKRIDHRHHALDALVIACATREHANLLNNKHAKSKNERHDLKRTLMNFEKVTYQHPKTGERIEREVAKQFFKPWETFTEDAQNALEKIVVSFKQNLRVINKATNHYESYKDENGNLRMGKDGKPQKALTEQQGVNWAIRKSMHTPMPSGKRIYNFDVLKIADSVGKRENIIDESIKLKVEEVLRACNGKVTDTQKSLKKVPLKDDNGNPILSTAFRIETEKFRKRQPISKLSNRGQGGIKSYDDALKFLNKIADYNLREDLITHLELNKNDIDLAFSPEGIERFNEGRAMPVYKLPIAESGSGRFSLGLSRGAKHKWVEADSGTNLFFAVYWDEAKKKRSYETIPLNEIIEHQKWRATLPKDERINTPIIPVKPGNGRFLFNLSPNDLVYVPTDKEIENPATVDFGNLSKEQMKRIYKMVSTTQDKLECVPVCYASPIVINEMGSNNKSQNTIEGIQIKAFGWKVVVDRLGNISRA